MTPLTLFCERPIMKNRRVTSTTVLIMAVLLLSCRIENITLDQENQGIDDPLTFDLSDLWNVAADDGFTAGQFVESLDWLIDDEIIAIEAYEGTALITYISCPLTNELLASRS